MQTPATFPGTTTSTVPSVKQQAQEIFEILEANPDGLTLVQIAIKYPTDIGAIAVSNRLHWLIHEKRVERIARPINTYIYRVKNDD